MLSSLLARLAENPNCWERVEDDGDDTFSEDHFIARIVNAHAAVRSPEFAYEFVDDLPVATSGRSGLNRRLFEPDGVIALYDAAIAHAADDLSRQRRVVSHLPETDEATRNCLITEYYRRFAIEADTLMGATGSRLAPGANWLDFAPWASAGVFNAIDGVKSGYGIKLSSTGRQATADGNQWIFNDVTRRFVRSIRVYRNSNGEPSAADLEAYFDDQFSGGDEEIRHGFLLHAAALATSDPPERQRLMFMGNVQVAAHEQAGADPYLSKLATGPDNQASRFIELEFGRAEENGESAQRIKVQHDISPTDYPAAIIDDPIMDLAPSKRPAADLAAQLDISLSDISGWTDRWNSPSRLQFDRMSEDLELADREVMRVAIDEARLSASEGGVPIGAVLAGSAHEILGRGHNERVQRSDPTAHGEISCLRNAGRMQSYGDSTLYTTLAPCPMCTGAVLLFKIPRVVVGENVNFRGEIEVLRNAGVKVVTMNDQECVDMMAKFIERNSTLWAEDIAEELDTGSRMDPRGRS